MRGIFYFFLIGFSYAVFGQNKKQLNVVFIAVDDLKPTIRSFGDAFAVTPNMDMLARKSTLFLNAHTQQAICSPSRISLLTGLRPDKTQVYDLKTKMRDKLPNVVTIPQHFKQMGYTTAGVGKIFDPRGVDKQSDDVSWSLPYKRAHQLKYPKDWGQPMVGYYQNQQIKEKIKSIIKKENISPSKVGDYLKTVFRPPFSSSPAPDEAYADGAIAAEALRMIDDLSTKRKPFFLAVGFKRPHLPFSAPKKYWNLYGRDRIPLAAFQERGSNIGRLAFKGPGEISKYPMDGRFYTTDNNGQLNLDVAFQRELVHGYYACASFIDFQIGKIVNKLKKEGLMGNTIIVIWGDHGFHLGDHRMWTKHSNFEQATRSPLIIYNPKTRAAQKIISPTEFVDIFPTLTDLAQIMPPSNVDGTSLLPMMMGQQQSVKEFAVSQYPRNNKMGYSFRTAAHRYTLWIEKSKIGQKISSKDIVQEELFDYNSDPLETKNHIGIAGYNKVYNDLKSKALSFLSPTVKSTSKLEAVPVSYEKGIKNLISEKGYDPDQVYIGATLNHRQLNTKVSDLFLQEFTYSTPENCAKQARIHPKPGVWDWNLINDYLDFADKNNITLRIHGPISPQASHWAKTDSRTKEELEKNMVEFFTALCKRMNKEPSVKWMDVVNETITPEGEWFEEKPGVKLWENPWEQIGRDENDVPLYITKAFEIANKYATEKSLVFNQHGGMEPKMWDKVKETILYLKAQGYRVDGLGWQAHLRSNKPLALDKKQLDYFASLIDWAHQHGLDFHVTEIDYQIMDSSINLKSLQDQASAYSNILKVLLSKRKNGVVTFNTWGMIDKNTGRHHDKFRFIFDKNSNPKPAYFALREAVVKPDDKLILK
jgi:arylsulfatase A-like enzyme/GH35 family endo-1,4-beta-xylanase